MREVIFLKLLCNFLPGSTRTISNNFYNPVRKGLVISTKDFFFFVVHGQLIDHVTLKDKK